MLGHSTSALTMDVYSHVLPPMQDDAAARTEALQGQHDTHTTVPAHSGAPGRIRQIIGTHSRR